MFADIASGKHPFAKTLAEAERPMVIFGQSVLRRDDADAFKLAVAGMADRVRIFQDDWDGVNVLQLAAARTAALDLGVVPGPTKDYSDIKLMYLVDADDYEDASIPESAFVVYQGHHGEKGAARADVILPGTAYTEKSGTYVNTEGRVQRTTIATSAVGQARPDWQIIRALSEVLGHALPYSTLEEIRERIVDIAPHMQQLDEVAPPSLLSTWATGVPDATVSSIAAGPIAPAIDDFFMTNVICRASRNMAKASAEMPNSKNSYV